MSMKYMYPVASALAVAAVFLVCMAVGGVGDSEPTADGAPEHVVQQTRQTVRPPLSLHSQQAKREFEIATVIEGPDAGEVRDYIERSDAVLASGAWSLERQAFFVQAVSVSEEDVVSWYSKNRGVFGERSVEESRRRIEKIIKLERLIAAMEGEVTGERGNTHDFSKRAPD